MKRNQMKWFALIGLLLFLGVAVAPSVNAGIVKKNIKERFENQKISLEKVNNKISKILGSENSVITLIILLIMLIISSSIALPSGIIYNIVYRLDILPNLEEIIYPIYVFSLYIMVLSFLLIHYAYGNR